MMPLKSPIEERFIGHQSNENDAQQKENRCYNFVFIQLFWIWIFLLKWYIFAFIEIEIVIIGHGVHFAFHGDGIWRIFKLTIG